MANIIYNILEGISTVILVILLFIGVVILAKYYFKIAITMNIVIYLFSISYYFKHTNLEMFWCAFAFPLAIYYTRRGHFNFYFNR